MSKDFNLNQNLTLHLSNGVNTFSYKITRIDFEDREVEALGPEGERGTFSFAMIEALGSIASDESDEPKGNDDPINLDDIPF